MKTLKKIRNTIAIVFLAIFLLFIVAISTLLLSRNDYGITQFDDKALIIIDDKISNNHYNEGQLVIVEEKDIDELRIGDEVFIYSSNQKTKKVEVIVSTIAEINNEDKYNPSVTLENDKGTWGIEFVAGTPYKKYEKLGRLLSIIQSKWIFFILLIVPCFFVLLYEIYLLVVLIKYDDGLDDEEDIKKSKKSKKVKESVKEDKETTKEEVKEKVEDKEDSKEIDKSEDKEVKEEKTEDKEEAKEESKEETKEETKEDKKSEDKEESKEEDKEDSKDDKKSEDKEESKDKEVNYDELAKEIVASDSSDEEIEKKLLELKEKMINEKKEKEQKAKQEKIDSLLKEISELKDELDK